MVVPLPWPMAAVSLAFGRVRPQTIAKLPFSIEHSGTRFIMFPSSTDSEANSQMLYAIEEIQGHGATFDRK